MVCCAVGSTHLRLKPEPSSTRCVGCLSFLTVSVLLQPRTHVLFDSQTATPDAQSTPINIGQASLPDPWRHFEPASVDSVATVLPPQQHSDGQGLSEALDTVAPGSLLLRPAAGPGVAPTSPSISVSTPPSLYAFSSPPSIPERSTTPTLPVPHHPAPVRSLSETYGGRLDYASENGIVMLSPPSSVGSVGERSDSPFEVLSPARQNDVLGSPWMVSEPLSPMALPTALGTGLASTRPSDTEGRTTPTRVGHARAASATSASEMYHTAVSASASSASYSQPSSPITHVYPAAQHETITSPVASFASFATSASALHSPTRGQLGQPGSSADVTQTLPPLFLHVPPRTTTPRRHNRHNYTSETDEMSSASGLSDLDADLDFMSESEAEMVSDAGSDHVLVTRLGTHRGPQRTQAEANWTTLSDGGSDIDSESGWSVASHGMSQSQNQPFGRAGRRSNPGL